MAHFAKSKKLLPLGMAISLSLLTVQAAHASSAFTSSATLTYTINSITNNTTPGNLTALAVQGTFQQAGTPDSFIFTTGDGSVTANNPPLSIGGGFSKTFAVNGTVTDGTVGSHHLGWYDLGFNNTGGDSYTIGVTLAYQLNAAVSGQFADSDVTVDYFNNDNSFAGHDFVNASLFGMTNASKSGASGLFSFTLGPNASEGLYADVAINGNLQSAVPVPGAVWLFGSAVVGMGAIGRRKNTASASV